MTSPKVRDSKSEEKEPKVDEKEKEGKNQLKIPAEDLYFQEMKEEKFFFWPILRMGPVTQVTTGVSVMISEATKSS